MSPPVLSEDGGEAVPIGHREDAGGDDVGPDAEEIGEDAVADGVEDEAPAGGPPR